MKRRDTLKTIVAGSIGTGLVLTGCKTDGADSVDQSIQDKKEAYGRTPEERARDDQFRETPFFNEHELATVAVLSDIIIPADEVSGSATEAGVPEFIDFMMHDVPEYQTRMRGGLMWLDHQCLEDYTKTFVDCGSDQQLVMLDHFAGDGAITPGYEQGEKFFALMRDLVATGFFTSQIGLKDLDYQGNVPNFWNGVPDEVLEKHGLSYDARWDNQYVKQDDINTIPEWDDDGNIIG